MSIWLMVWSTAVASILAGRLTIRALPAGPNRAVAGLVLLCGICVGVLFMCGAVGQVNAVAVAMATTTALAAEWLVLGELPTQTPNRLQRLEVAALAGLTVAALTWLPLATSGGAYGWDDLTYHAAVPGHWLQTETLSLPPFTYQAYYPLNSELLSLWFMLPGSDAHIHMGVLVWAGLVVAAGVSIGRTGDLGLTGGALLMIVFAATPKVWEVAQTTSASDLAVTALGMGALALAWSPDARSPLPTAGLCGIAAGLALGAKVSMAPLVLLLALWWALESRRVGDFRPLGLFAVAVFALGSWWYIRNLWITGNPLFPAAFGPFDGPLDAAAQRETSLLGVLQRPARYPDALQRILTGRLDWPLPLGMLSAIGYCSALVATARQWRDEKRRATWLLLTTLAGLSFVALFVISPYSGTTNQPDYALHKMVRYLTFPFALGLALVPAAFPRLHGERITLRNVPRAAMAAAAVLFLVGVGLRTTAKERSNADLIFRWGGKARPLGHAWQALEDLPAGSRIASLTKMPGSHAFLYPLFGREFQHVPVTVMPDGKARGFLHEEWEQRGGWWWEFEHRPKTALLVENLRGAKVDFVLVSKWSKAKWPPHRQVLRDQLGEQAIVYRDRYSEIWKVGR